jgi:hypothetical protein
MEPEQVVKGEGKPKAKESKLDFNSDTAKQLDSLKKLAHCIHQKTNVCPRLSF